MLRSSSFVPAQRWVRRAVLSGAGIIAVFILLGAGCARSTPPPPTLPPAPAAPTTPQPTPQPAATAPTPAVTTPTTPPAAPPAAAKPAAPKFTLSIVTPKSTYSVGEKFSGGSYQMSYTGEPFVGIVLYGYSRKGFERNASYDKSTGTIRTGNFATNPSIMRPALLAFVLGDEGYSSGADAFEEAGEYTFTMAVYRCADVGLSDADCMASEVSERLILSKRPVASTSKKITVVTGSTPTTSTPSQPTALPAGYTTCVLEDTPQFGKAFAEKNCNFIYAGFPSCQRGARLSSPPIFGLVMEMEVIGPRSGRCDLKFWYSSHPEGPSSGLVNVPMTCNISNARGEADLEAFTDGLTTENVLRSCTGPLKAKLETLQAQD